VTSGTTTTLRAVRLRPLSESECYARCYGQRGDESVRVIRVEPRRPRYDVKPLTGEGVRRLFAERLDTREPEAA
jgi:hypothetical protein